MGKKEWRANVRGKVSKDPQPLSVRFGRKPPRDAIEIEGPCSLGLRLDTGGLVKLLRFESRPLPVPPFDPWLSLNFFFFASRSFDQPHPYLDI